MNPTAISIIELTLKGTAILLAGFGGAAVLARSSAAHRSLWWAGIFAILLVVPLGLLIRPVWTLPVHTGSEFRSSPAASLHLHQALEGSNLETITASHPGGWLQVSLRQWLLAGYGCGVIAVLSFRLLGSWQLWSLRRATVEASEAQITVDQWRNRFGVRRPVRVLTSSRVTVPMTWGVWRPVIMLPDNCRDWTWEEFQAAMQHEFAHICHLDAARRWLGMVVCALWWPHPLAWFAARTWKLEQERACDDAVLNGGGDAAGYARQLLVAARGLNVSRFQSAAALVMAMPPGLEARLCSVMSNVVDRSPVRVRSLLGVGIVTFAAMAGSVAFQAQSVGAPPAEQSKGESLEKKAAALIIPKIEFKEATTNEVLEFIAVKTGFRIIYRAAPADSARLTMILTNIPASEALKYVAHLAGLEVTYTDSLVLVKGSNSNAADAITTEFGGPGLQNGSTPASKKAESAAMRKAQKIIFPVVDLREASVSEALDFLRKNSIALDPQKQGVAITLKPGSDPGVRISLKLSNIPLDEALRYVAGLSNLELHAEPNALVLEAAKSAEIKGRR